MKKGLPNAERIDIIRTQEQSTVKIIRAIWYDCTRAGRSTQPRLRWLAPSLLNPAILFVFSHVANFRENISDTATAGNSTDMQVSCVA